MSDFSTFKGEELLTLKVFFVMDSTDPILAEIKKEINRATIELAQVSIIYNYRRGYHISSRRLLDR